MPNPRTTALNNPTVLNGPTGVIGPRPAPLNSAPGVLGQYSAPAWTLARQLASLQLSDTLLQHCERLTTPRPHELWTYWQDDDTLPSGGRLVLPDGASKATLVYSAPRTGPQCVTIVVLAGETVQEAGIAWIAETSAVTGYPHRLIYVGKDDDAAAEARARALFAGT